VNRVIEAAHLRKTFGELIAAGTFPLALYKMRKRLIK